MIVGLVIGKKTSTGVPGKNTRMLLGRPTCEYAFMAAKTSKHVDKLYTSTDCEQIAAIGKRYGATHIQRPEHLARPDSLTEDTLLHALQCIEEDLGRSISMMALFIANNPAINVSLMDEGIARIQSDDRYDGAFSVCKYNMFSVARAKRLMPDGTFQPFVESSILGNINSLRDSQGDTYFADMSIQVMKRSCLTDMAIGQKPLTWMGRRPLALMNDYGFDIDAEWQFVVIEHWLKQHGFKEG